MGNYDIESQLLQFSFQQFPCQNSRDDFETRIYRSSKSNEPTRCRVQSENAQRQFLRELLAYASVGAILGAEKNNLPPPRIYAIH